MKKKGFTLIELLAVVIILAVVSLVSTPIVLDVIDDARSNANKESAYGIVKAGEYYYAESMLDDSKKYNVENINDIYDQITVTGNKPEDGKLYVNNKGQVAMSITIGNNCYVKDFYSEVEELDSNDENCDLGYVSVDEVAPKVEISIKGEASPTGWYTESPYIHIKVEDLESGISNYRWCQGMNCDAANSENVETNLEKDILILDSKETQVCVIAYDKANNETQLCSDVLKVDTVKPEFSGIMADSNIPLNQEIDLVTGVEVFDVTSGINGTYKILNKNDEEITSIDTSKSGVHEIRYVVTDNAGNETITTVTIEVSGTAPTITYSVEDGVFNENGWSNKDFIVTINVTDNSGHGIDSFNVCTATTDTCDPSTGSIIEGTTGAREIVQEDSNNRICVSVTDKSGKTSTLCSSAYKLDKTAPTAGTIKVNGSNEIKDWYTEDATIEVVEGSDSLSGHLSTTSNITSITENTTGTVVTVTTTDNAGNTSTRDYTIRVDKTLPSITIEEPSIDGLNGWYKNKPTIKLTATDTISEFDKLMICQGVNCEPSEEITTSLKEITIEDTKETQVCAIAYDKAGNVSEKVCSNTLKVDTVDPEIDGIGDIIIGLNGIVDLETGVEITDATSGINVKVIPTTETINVSKAGTYSVTYKAVDNAGREKTITRNVIVATTAPTITFTPTADEIGWAKEEFEVTINVSDNSGHGIKSFNVCTATTDRCEPSEGSVITDSTTATRIITTESNNNRICVQATDNFAQTSEIICSDAYKIDRTLPTVSYSVLGGTYNEYKTIRIIPSDSNYSYMNIHVYKDGTVVDIKSKNALETSYYDVTLDSNGVWKVYAQVYDKSGNKQEQTPNNGTGASGWYYQTYTIDTNKPTVTISKTVSNNQNVLTATVTPATTISNYSYQWYKDNNPISGATGSSYTTTTAGIYKVIVTTGAGKSTTSNEITIQSYAVSYNLNGGTGSIGNTTKVQDLSTSITNTVPTRSGYTFMGWGSSATDTTADYASGATYTANSGTTLYAIWKKTVTVTFNANGATLTGTTTPTCEMYNADTSCTVTAPTISRSGFTITGFNTSSSATTSQVSNGGTATVSSNTTYYAITSKEVTVTFNKNGASSITPSGGSASTATSITQSCTIQNSATTCNITSPSITASSNTPTVLGWNTSANSTSSAWNVSTAKVFSSNATYYAVTTKGAVTRSITYAKGTGVSAIGATTGTCTIAATYNGTAQSGSCSITLPTITASTGYTTSGWYNSSNTKLGNASASISVSANQTITAKATANSYTCSAGYYLGASATSCTKCEAGSYCPGGTYTFTSTVQGKNTCPSGYGSSAAGSSTASNCYLTTTAGKYIATANSSTQTACQSGYYCPATTIYYGNTGGRSTCPSGYETSPASSTAASNCYKTITVSYAGNGATSGSTASSTCNAYYGNGSCSISLRANGFTKTSYTFQGWGTTTSSVSHNAGTSYSFSSNTTLNAIWKSSTICKRATSLHTVTCLGSTCDGPRFTYGWPITYGSYGTPGTLTSGDAFDCDVNGDGVYDAATERFYYVSDLFTASQTFDSNYAVLIYYKNFAEDVPYSTYQYNSYGTAMNNYGPKDAIKKLPTTSQWPNVTLKTTSRRVMTEYGETSTYSGNIPTVFSYEGYAARLLTHQEIVAACKVGYNFEYRAIETGRCEYMLQHTEYDSTTGSDYWLENPSGSGYDTAFIVDGSNAGFGGNVIDYNKGVRPVIEVPKANMSY